MAYLNVNQVFFLPLLSFLMSIDSVNTLREENGKTKTRKRFKVSSLEPTHTSKNN